MAKSSLDDMFGAEYEALKQQDALPPLEYDPPAGAAETGAQGAGGGGETPAQVSQQEVEELSSVEAIKTATEMGAGPLRDAFIQKNFAPMGGWDRAVARNVLERDLPRLLRKKAAAGDFDPEEPVPPDEIKVFHLYDNNFAILRGEKEKPLVVEDAEEGVVELLHDAVTDNIYDIAEGVASGVAATFGASATAPFGMPLVGGMGAGAAAAGASKAAHVAISKFLTGTEAVTFEDYWDEGKNIASDIVSSAALGGIGELIGPAIKAGGKVLWSPVKRYTLTKPLEKMAKEGIGTVDGYIANQARKHIEKAYKQNKHLDGLQDFATLSQLHRGTGKGVAEKTSRMQQISTLQHSEIAERYATQRDAAITGTVNKMLNSITHNTSTKKASQRVFLATKAVVKGIRKKWESKEMMGATFDTLRAIPKSQYTFNGNATQKYLTELLKYRGAENFNILPNLLKRLEEGIGMDEVIKTMSDLSDAKHIPIVFDKSIQPGKQQKDIAGMLLEAFKSDLEDASINSPIAITHGKQLNDARAAWAAMNSEIEALHRESMVKTLKKMVPGGEEKLRDIVTVDDLVDSDVLLRELASQDPLEADKALKMLSDNVDPDAAATLRRKLIEDKLEAIYVTDKGVLSNVGREVGEPLNESIVSRDTLFEALRSKKSAQDIYQYIDDLHGGNPNNPITEGLRALAQWSEDNMTAELSGVAALGQATPYQDALLLGAGAGMATTGKVRGALYGGNIAKALTALQEKIIMNKNLANVIFDPNGARVLKKIFSPRQEKAPSMVVMRQLEQQASRLLAAMAEEVQETFGEEAASGQSGAGPHGG